VHQVVQQACMLPATRNNAGPKLIFAGIAMFHLHYDDGMS
jgi:hypothetical protein